MEAPSLPPRKRLGWLSLFASSSTLLCCALPITLVSLGLGSVSAAIFANVPGLKFLAKHEIWLFVFSALVLGFSMWSVYRPGRACPTDKELGAQCQRAERWNKRILKISILIWCVGFTSAFLSVPIMNMVDRISG